MKLQRQHFLLSYLKTLSVGPESRTHDLLRHSPVHNQVSHRCAASKPVARRFKPSYSIPLQHDNLRAILTPREHRKPQKSQTKNSSSNWVYSIHMRSMNACHSTNSSTNSYDHISTNGKAPPHSYINLQHPTIPLFALTKY